MKLTHRIYRMNSETYVIRDNDKVVLELERGRIVTVGGIPHTLLTERISKETTGQETVIVQQVVAQIGKELKPCILHYCQKTV